MERLPTASPGRPKDHGATADISLPGLQAVLGAYCLDRLSLSRLISLRQVSRLLVFTHLQSGQHTYYDGINSKCCTAHTGLLRLQLGELVAEADWLCMIHNTSALQISIYMSHMRNGKAIASISPVHQ